ncbi:MAG: molybdopterin-dependent oxidoreductase [Phycisphaerales bacterium JB039]
MPSITINGVQCEFEPGQTILQVANARGVKIPYYCDHDGLSIPAQCRICLGEIWAPNPRNDNKVEPLMGGKLQPTCSTRASEGMVVWTDSPKAVANQKAVMEYLLINHPLDCPVCDQAGECELQDYSYQYGRSVSRFQEQKVKQPKKDLGPHVAIYSDRCIMCTRCVRFAREVAGTGELMIAGRGNKSEIDVFPGKPLANELSGNVVDICPVGALLDKDFLFAQRVWFLKRTASIDGITASGDNIWVEHNEGKVYRIKPRENPKVNRWWITDEVRYGWKHILSEERLQTPALRKHGVLVEADYERVDRAAVEGLTKAVATGGRLALLVSPMLATEEAYLLAELARQIDPRAILGVGPVPVDGEDKVFPVGAKRDDPDAFVMFAEKAPNARGVRRARESFGAKVHDADGWMKAATGATCAIVTGNYPSDWATADLLAALEGKFVVLLDTLRSRLLDRADIVLPASAWVEKAGSFESARGMTQAFLKAVPAPGLARPEGQHALDLAAALEGNLAPAARVLEFVDNQPGQVTAARELLVPRAAPYDASAVRARMADAAPDALGALAEVVAPVQERKRHTDMPLVQL